MRKLLVLVAVAACGTDPTSGDDMPPPEGVVYYGQVDHILADNCVSCHSADPDRLAPFSLASYADAVDAAKNQAVSSFVMTRQMPPFFAINDGSCGNYTSEWLSDDDISTLTAWFNGDQAQGDPTKASAGPPGLAQLDHVSTTLDAGADYLPPTDAGTDLYRCFIVDPQIATDQFLTGNFVHPVNSLIVHHVIVYSLPDATAEQQAADLDAADPGLGYTCFGGPGVASAGFVTGWAPGQGAVLFPDTTGVRVLGGRKLIMQVHYNLINFDGTTPDHTTIDLQLVPSVALEAKIADVSASPDLPPKQTDAQAVASHVLPNVPLQLWGSAIHMHTRGTKADVRELNGSGQCLIDLANWSFHWQNFYWETSPVTLAQASDLQITCHYDTTNDTVEVKNGEKTTDEMCKGFLYLTQ
jgi:hypothetical protein